MVLPNKTKLDWIAFIVVVIGAVNWGLVGTLDFDLVAFLFGALPLLGRIVYVVVGLAGIYLLYAVAKPESGSAARPAFTRPPQAPQPPAVNR